MPKIIVQHRANKKVRLLTQKEKEKVSQAIAELGENPFSQKLNTIKLKGTKSSYRVRIGDLRLIYEWRSGDDLLVLREIDYRGSVY